MIRFTADQKYHEVLRELALRRKLYPRWIAEGRVSEEEAKKRINIMAEIADDYDEQVKQERLL
jgi:hypothetical protein